MSYNIADGDLWWGIGYLILDKDDPTKILQRESRMLWPSFAWERADPTDPETSWEYYKNCVRFLCLVMLATVSESQWHGPPHTPEPPDSTPAKWLNTVQKFHPNSLTH